MSVHLEVEDILDVKVKGGPRNWTRTGYGEHALSMMVLVGPRWRRLYILHYGNGGATPYIKAGSESWYLSPEAEELVNLVFQDPAGGWE
jgi:hypothetical protein